MYQSHWYYRINLLIVAQTFSVISYGSYGYSSELIFKHEAWAFDVFYLLLLISRGGRLGAWYEVKKCFESEYFLWLIAWRWTLIGENTLSLTSHCMEVVGWLQWVLWNMRPELFNGWRVFLFVDVVTTMLDESIPLYRRDFRMGKSKSRNYDYIAHIFTLDRTWLRSYQISLSLQELPRQPDSIWSDNGWPISVSSKCDQLFLLH